MEHDNEISAESILKNRRFKRNFEVPPDAEITSLGARQINRAAAMRFAKACDAGVWKRITSMVLEPGNPFDQKTPRRLRREAVLLGGMILVLLVAALYFNVLAR